MFYSLFDEKIERRRDERRVLVEALAPRERERVRDILLAPQASRVPLPLSPGPYILRLGRFPE